jgi:hypothetical protein
MIRLLTGAAVIFILLALWGLIKTNLIRKEAFGLVYSNFEDMPPAPNNPISLGESSQKPVSSDINDIDAQGILDAAQGIRNSVIPNAPFPPSVGMIDNMKPIDEKANYEDLRNKLRNLERQLPTSVKEQIANLTPAIVNGMLEARDKQYLQ